MTSAETSYEVQASPAPGNPFHLAIPVHSMKEGTTSQHYVVNVPVTQILVPSVYCYSARGEIVKEYVVNAVLLVDYAYL
jgi:hypothetical protein